MKMFSRPKSTKFRLTTIASAFSLIAVMTSVPEGRAATAPKLTPVYCNDDGSTGLPQGSVDRFVNVSGRGLCLYMGEATQDTSPHLSLVGARVDNAAGGAVGTITFNARNWLAADADRLILYMYFVTPKGATVYAYAYASSPTSKIPMPNGDTHLTFSPSAFTTIPGGISLTGAKFKDLQIGLTDAAYYEPVTFTIYGVTVDGVAVSSNVVSPVQDCTF